jgi:hypothetical protein
MGASEVLSGQQIETIYSEPTCPKCLIRMGPAILLGSTDGGEWELPDRIRSSLYEHGMYYISPGGASLSELISVFDAGGRPAYKIGKVGQGPNEYRLPWLLDVRGDTAWVADAVNARLTKVQLSVNRELSSTLLPELAMGPTDLLLEPGGALVAAMTIRNSEAIGFPVHRYDKTGNRVLSFGTVEPFYRPDQPRQLMRRIAQSHDGGLWAAHLTKYVIERYDRENRLVQTLVRAAEWFPGDHGQGPAPTPPNEPVPPQTFIHEVLEDRHGLLWVVSLVPDANWRKAVGQVDSGPRLRWRILDVNGYQDSRIEVLDPATGRLVVSAIIDEVVINLLTDSTVSVATVRYTRDGVPQVAISTAVILGTRDSRQ